MKQTIFAPFFIVSIFAAILFYIGEVTFSNAFGWLGFSIAIGSLSYFMVFAPYGLRTHTTVFGRRQKYRRPVAEIPGKIAGLILCLVVICLAISFGFYTYAS